MNILCINTAFQKANIALSYNNKNYFIETDSTAKHSENLLLEIEKLLENVKQKDETSYDVLNKINVLSIVVGPGSFTGLRIGIATAKAILLTHCNMKICAINSLELIASLSAKNEKTPIIDGLSGYYFIAKYDKHFNCLLAPIMISQEEVYTLSNLVSHEKLPFKTEIITLSSESLLNLTCKKILQNNFTTESQLIPLYLRPSQAEVNYDSNNK